MIVYKRGKGRKRGRGIFDFFKPIVEGVKTVINAPGTSDIIKNAITIGKNTKSVIDSIKNKRLEAAAIAEAALQAVARPVVPPVVTQIYHTNEIDKMTS